MIKIADQIRSLGFDEADFLATREGLDEFYDEANSTGLGAHSRAIGLMPNVFVYQSADWNAADQAVRDRNLEYFEKCAKVAKWVGCRIVSSLSPSPRGAAGWRFKPSAPAQKQSFRLPADYNFRKDWETLIDGYKSALSIAKRLGLRMSIECFPLSMVATTHAMLKALEDIGDADFGIQLDTNHLVAQHIDPEWTVRVLGGKSIFNMHCKDHDSVSRGNIPAGCGITDYTAVIGALRDVGYAGNLTVELEFTDNPSRYNRQALEHLKLCAKGEY
jgi:sugar phosphate isomerase/epimerase